MGAVFALFAGFYYWTPKIVGRNINDFLGKIHFWTLFVGVKQISQSVVGKLRFYFISLALPLPIVASLQIKGSFAAYKGEKAMVKSKPITINEIVNDLIEDKDSNDINLETFNNKLNNLPNSKSPNPKKGKSKLIFEKLNNIPAEFKFIGLNFSKLDILLNTKDKAGVYMFFNLKNGNIYVGSSINLARRFRVHISNIGNVNLPLPLAINKYGPDNFAFLILQFCSAPAADDIKKVCLSLEQYFIDLYKPKYNILKLAGSSQGFKHSPDTIAKLKAMHIGKLHPRFNTKVSDQQKVLSSLALKKHFAPLGKGCEAKGENIQQNKGKKGPLAPQFGIGGKNIIIKSENGDVLSFPSINACRQQFRVRFSTISNNVNKDLPILIKGIKWYVSSN